MIAEVQIDSPSSDVILTANGYKKKAALKNALVNIDYDNTKAVLKFMLKDGAYLYKAVCQQEIVGAVVIVRLPGEFSLHPSSSGTPAPQGLPFPPIHDLKAVKAYARCKDVDDDFSYQLRGLLNSRLRYHGVGQLWGEHPSFLWFFEYNLTFTVNRIFFLECQGRVQAPEYRQNLGTACLIQGPKSRYGCHTSRTRHRSHVSTFRIQLCSVRV